MFVKLTDAQKDNQMHFFPFSDALQLKEVILGPLCSDTVLDTTRSLVHAMHPGAVVGKARPGLKYFEIKTDGGYPVR